MKVRVIISMAFLAITVASVHTARAQGEEGGNAQFEALQKQILELQHQMEEMKKAHETEIKALKEEIAGLRQAPVPVKEEVKAEDEAAKLRALAESLAGEKEVEKPAEETVFKYAGLSLQQLNPEISVSGDFVGHYRHQDSTRERADAEMRGLELNFQSYLDPFSRMKATTHVHNDGEIHLEEAYFTRFSMFENVNLDIGKFRQQFGVVNRWHEDALDQVEYPLAMRNILGDEGLAQTGASLDWTLPNWGNAYQGLTLQVTNPDNDRLFGEDTLGNPCLLFHYKNYRDLSRDRYLEFGLSGLLGWNDQWQVRRGGMLQNEYDTLGTRVFGADLSYLWEPADRALYRNLEWRSEVYLMNRDILAPDDSGRDNLSAWGLYSYLQSRIARNLEVGVRYDYYEPESKDYANVSGASLAPLAYTANDAYRWQICPYITWWQSEFVKFRCEYDFADGRGMEGPEHVLWLQAIFAAGPHKHERY
jgi:Skp family chaperone for outer membrane proteins